jgi:hypothetical protein
VIWLLLVVGVGLIAWFLFAPRRLQTLENTPAVVDENFRADGIVETTEDPREVAPIALEAAKKAGDRPAPGHGDSLTFDWPNDPQEAHNRGAKEEGPLNRQE